MSEDRDITISDSGQGRSGMPRPAYQGNDVFFGSIGIAWYAVASVVTKYPQAKDVASILRKNGFSASFVVELFSKVETLGPTVLSSIMDHWPLAKEVPA